MKKTNKPHVPHPHVNGKKVIAGAGVATVLATSVATSSVNLKAETINTDSLINEVSVDNSFKINPNIVSQNTDNYVKNGEVYMENEVVFANGSFTKTTVIAEEVPNPNTRSYSGMPNKSSACTNGTYWFGCDNLRIFTQSGIGDNVMQLYLIVDISSSNGGTTSIKIVDKWANAPGKVISSPVMYNSTPKVSYGNTAIVKIKATMSDKYGSVATLSTGVSCKGSYVTFA